LFEDESALELIASDVFAGCPSLTSITIPRRVRLLGANCFFTSVGLSAVSFEGGSQLERIEARTFGNTKVRSIVLPPHVSFIAADAFPRPCRVRFLDIGHRAQLESWDWSQWSREHVDFERQPE
jgi:hypothetical protein